MGSFYQASTAKGGAFICDDGMVWQPESMVGCLLLMAFAFLRVGALSYDRLHF